MSAEAWVGLAALVCGVLTAIGTGVIIWMSRVHWLLAGIKADISNLASQLTLAAADLGKVWSELDRMKERLTKVEVKLRLQPERGSWINRRQALEEKEQPNPYDSTDDEDSDDANTAEKG